MAVENPAAGHGKLPTKSFNDEIEAHGIDITLRKGLRCPCIDEGTGQPDPNCTVCEGWGTVWSAGTGLRVLGPNRRIDRRYEEPGTIDLGDAYFTFPAGTFVSHLDRMVLPDEMLIVSELLTKGDVNALTGATKEKVRFGKVLEVEQAAWIAREPVDGTPYRTVLTELTVDTDFEIVGGNQVSWLGPSSPPPEGARYSLRYRTEAEYLVWSPRGRREGSENLPYVYLCKRLDFLPRG